MDRAVSPAVLAGRAGRLAARFWAPLLLWYALGQLVHDLILRGAAEVGSRGPSQGLLATEYTAWRVVGLAVMSMGVLAVLGAAILMLHSVERGMPAFQAALRSRLGWTAEADPSTGAALPVGGERRMVDTVAQTLLPFVVFYGAWGLFTSDARQYAITGINTTSDVSLLLIPVNWFSVGVALGALALRIACERWLSRTGNKVIALVTPAFEAIWMFFAVITVGVVVRDLARWLTSRTLWTSIKDASASLADALDVVMPLSAADALAWLSRLWPDVKDGMLLPLLWLTIAAVVYGEDMESDRRAVEGTRLARLHRVSRGWARLPRRVRSVLDVASRELREKWTPAANGLRLALRGGARFSLSFCLCYVALQALTKWGWIGATRLIGPHPWEWWQMALVPLDFARDALYEVLRICLLAVVFDLALSRVVLQGSQPAPASLAEPVTGRTAGTASGPTMASEPRAATS